MTVEPKRHDDSENAAGQSGSEGSLPPTLFALPNLSAADSCQTANETGADSENPTCENANTCKSVSFAEITPPAEPPTDERLPTADEAPVELAPVSNQPPEPTSRSKDALVNIWGTRAVIFGLVLVAIASAVVTTRKAHQHRESSPVAEADESMADVFAVSEGQEASVTEGLTEVSVPPASDAVMIAAETQSPAGVPSEPVEPAEAIEPVAQVEIAANATVPSVPAVVLSAPVAEPPVNGLPNTIQNEPPADAVANVGPPAGAEMGVAVSAVSNRTNSSEWTVTPPKRNEFATTKDGPVDFVASQTAAPAAESQQTTANFSGNNSPSPPVPTSENAEKPSSSQSFRYSSTPHGMSDLIRFLPPAPDKTTTP